MRVSHGDDEQMDADDEATGGGKKRKARSKSAAQRKRAPVTKRFHPPHGVLSPRVPAPPKGAKPPIPLNLVSARYLKEGDNATVFVSGPPVAGFDYSAFNFTAADFHEDEISALRSGSPRARVRGRVKAGVGSRNHVLHPQRQVDRRLLVAQHQVARRRALESRETALVPRINVE